MHTTGDVVSLKSGGPRMTVQRLIGDHQGRSPMIRTVDEALRLKGFRDGDPICEWFQAEVHHERVFAKDSIFKVDAITAIQRVNAYSEFELQSQNWKPFENEHCYLIPATDHKMGVVPFVTLLISNDDQYQVALADIRIARNGDVTIVTAKPHTGKVVFK